MNSLDFFVGLFAWGLGASLFIPVIVAAVLWKRPVMAPIAAFGSAIPFIVMKSNGPESTAVLFFAATFSFVAFLFLTAVSALRQRKPRADDRPQSVS